MKLKLFSIYDSKSKAHSNPFCSAAAGSAIRGFIDLVMDEKSNVAKHPGDYTLMEIGGFDDCTGCLSPHKAAINLGTALSLKPTE